jgi:hypothetical protein
MSEEILLRFLSIGLIDIGDDDAKFEKLRGTVTDLGSGLKKNWSKTLAFTLVAADPNISADDPTIQEAMAALQKRWPTIANTFSGTPIGVIRALLLEAIVQASSEEEVIGTAFVECARNVLPYLELGDEREIWSDVVTEIEARIEKRAEFEWGTPKTVTVKPFDFESPTIETPRLQIGAVDRGPFGNFSGAMRQFGSPWQNQNWINEFVNRLAEAIEVILEGVANNSKIVGMDVCSAPLKSLAESVSGYVQMAFEDYSRATAGLQRRTNLLWWKEALFSPSVRLSYRDLSPFDAAALMALDLHAQIPIFSPVSLSAFLSEAIRAVLSAGDNESKRILLLVNEARTANHLEPLRETGRSLIGVPVGRGPILSIIAHAPATAAIDENEFRMLTGIRTDLEVTPPAWGRWLFRELQAARAVGVVAALKRARRKR